jgi:hypothetical protein
MQLYWALVTAGWDSSRRLFGPVVLKGEMKYNIAKVVALILSICAFALATEPRRKLEDYSSHMESPAVNIGVDYQVHSFSAEGHMYFTKDYLVCEIGIYPKVSVELTGSSFELRINRSKNSIRQASPEFVAASLKYPDWTRHPQLEVGAGAGDSSVILGRPPAIGRFPGDPSVGRRQPQPPRAPEDPDKPVIDEAQLALDSALRQGTIATPAAGNVYFEYSGNLKKIRNLSLMVHTSAGDLEVPIR